jgi:hypothetical protein
LKNPVVRPVPPNFLSGAFSMESILHHSTQLQPSHISFRIGNLSPLEDYHSTCTLVTHGDFDPPGPSTRTHRTSMQPIFLPHSFFRSFSALDEASLSLPAAGPVHTPHYCGSEHHLPLLQLPRHQQHRGFSRLRFVALSSSLAKTNY